MEILNEKQVEQKIRRLSYEIVEDHIDSEHLILIGLNENGLKMANWIKKEIAEIPDHNINITIHQAHYRSETQTVDLSISTSDAQGKSVIVVDDVANTGSTLFKTAALLSDAKTAHLSAAVLVDRKHKSYPIAVEYVGLSLATTINDHVQVKFNTEYSAKVSFSSTFC